MTFHTTFRSEFRMQGSSWSSICINDSCLFQEAKVMLELGLEAANQKSGWYLKTEFCQFSHHIVSSPIGGDARPAS